MNKYLENSDFIDWKNPLILNKAKELSRGIYADVDIARKCFEYVRDEIKHSWDYKLNPVTCRASDVLLHKTGYCYAKSHLLAALLRANGIPTGLCYQRLTIKQGIPPFCLHGLNAVYLQDFGWYRLDPRGNKQGVESLFMPPFEKLAFSISIMGEADLPEIWNSPLQEIVKVLTFYSDIYDVAENLPDVELVNIKHLKI